MKKIQNAYDIEDFYQNYKKMRDGKINANELLEIPVMKSMLGDLENKSIIDLGCGNGDMSRYFIENNAKDVLAIDISNNMLEEAKQTNNLKEITYLNLPLENLDKIKQKFDFAYSSLAFHYIEDFNKLLKDIHNLLNENGILLFSQEHPFATAPIFKGVDKYIEVNDKRYYLISDYNDNSQRERPWYNDILIKYHRNFTNIINALINQGFEILELKEAEANEEVIKLVDKYKYQNDRPYFLFIKAKKKSA